MAIRRNSKSPNRYLTRAVISPSWIPIRLEAFIAARCHMRRCSGLACTKNAKLRPVQRSRRSHRLESSFDRVGAPRAEKPEEFQGKPSNSLSISSIARTAPGKISRTILALPRRWRYLIQIILHPQGAVSFYLWSGVHSMSVSEETIASTATAPIPLTPTVVKRGLKIAVIDTTKAGRALPKIDEGASTEVGGGRESYAVTALADIVDRSLHAAAGNAKSNSAGNCRNGEEASRRACCSSDAAI